MNPYYLILYLLHDIFRFEYITGKNLIINSRNLIGMPWKIQKSVIFTSLIIAILSEMGSAGGGQSKSTGRRSGSILEEEPRSSYNTASEFAEFLHVWHNFFPYTGRPVEYPVVPVKEPLVCSHAEQVHKSL
jgi:hypothetical protein